MKLFLDTSTDKVILKLDEKSYEEILGHDMAEKLLGFINSKLEENHKTWQELSEIEYFSGPGSFTGLRIGAAVVNALASELDIPLKDHLGNTHKQIIPIYGKGANITAPKK